jgi:proteasome component ECM29
MVTTAGESLKPFLPQLIPALVQATGDLESAKLSQLSVMLGERQQTQEIVDNARAQAAKSHYTTETVAKVILYIFFITFI